MAKIFSHGSGIKNQLLNIIKEYVTFSTFKDVERLLSPCCKPTLTVEENYACNGSDTEFTSVTVNAGSKYASKTAVLIFTFGDSAREDHTTATETVTFDSNGDWTGGVNTLTYFANGSTTITVGILEVGSSVVVTSEAVLAENIQNCD